MNVQNIVSKFLKIIYFITNFSYHKTFIKILSQYLSHKNVQTHKTSKTKRSNNNFQRMFKIYNPRNFLNILNYYEVTLKHNVKPYNPYNSKKFSIPSKVLQSIIKSVCDIINLMCYVFDILRYH